MLRQAPWSIEDDAVSHQTQNSGAPVCAPNLLCVHLPCLLPIYVLRPPLPQRFPHRGLMVDTARHFQPVASLKATIDSLTYAKLNVLHWHASDSQSFPFQSKSHPKLWEGAFSAEERYTQLDAREVVEYGRLRGVRVIVEFDRAALPVVLSLSRLLSTICGYLRRQRRRDDPRMHLSMLFAAL